MRRPSASAPTRPAKPRSRRTRPFHPRPPLRPRHARSQGVPLRLSPSSPREAYQEGDGHWDQDAPGPPPPTGGPRCKGAPWPNPEWPASPAQFRDRAERSLKGQRPQRRQVRPALPAAAAQGAEPPLLPARRKTTAHVQRPSGRIRQHSARGSLPAKQCRLDSPLGDHRISYSFTLRYKVRRPMPSVFAQSSLL